MSEVLSLYRGLIDVPPPLPSMREMAQEIAQRHGVTMAVLMGPCQRNCSARPRLEAYATIYATGRYSLTRIGNFFGRDHTSVLYGIRAHKKRLAEAAARAAGG